LEVIGFDHEIILALLETNALLIFSDPDFPIGYFPECLLITMFYVIFLESVRRELLVCFDVSLSMFNVFMH
jgi:hypothetical protein